MNASGPNPYLKTKVLTASPEELRLMLYEGAIKFCAQGREALENNDFENSHAALMRAQKIVLELSTSLKHDIDPELCGKFGAIYNWIYRLLVDANVKHDPKLVDEAVELLHYERETWQLLISRVAEEVGGNPPTPSGGLSLNG